MQRVDLTKSGVDLIAAERERQVSEEGWTTEHDDKHINGELAMAAVCFAAPRTILERIDGPDFSLVLRDPWPWDREWDGRARNQHQDLWQNEDAPPEKRLDLLVKSGALIAAEIDRLIRIERPAPAKRDRKLCS